MGELPVPEELLQQLYRCPDCAAEHGDDGMRPGSAFPWTKAARYRNGFRRGAYCKVHQSRRSSKARRKQLAEAPKDSPVWQAKRAADNVWNEKNRKKRREQWRAASKTWRKRHPEAARSAVANYAERRRQNEHEELDPIVTRRRERGTRPLRRKRNEGGSDAQ